MPLRLARVETRASTTLPHAGKAAASRMRTRTVERMTCSYVPASARIRLDIPFATRIKASAAIATPTATRIINPVLGASVATLAKRKLHALKQSYAVARSALGNIVTLAEAPDVAPGELFRAFEKRR
jgi:hypothetical protein